jgi:hypothetical protein
VVERNPSSHCSAVVPSAGRTQADAQVDATCSAAAGALLSGSDDGVGSDTGGSAVGAGIRGSRGVDDGAARGVPDPVVAELDVDAAASGAGGFRAVRAVLTPTTPANTTAAVTASRAGDRSGHCQTAR